MRPDTLAAALAALLCGCAGTGAAAPPAPAPPASVGVARRPVPTAAPAPDPPPRDGPALVLGAVGDVLMHGAVKEAAAAHGGGGPDEGYGWLFRPVADLLSATDLTVANLESPIAPRGAKGTRSYVFNAPPAAARALRGAGIRLVNVANNHAFDQGRAGFLETLAELDRAGLPWVGAGPEPEEAGPRLLAVNGLRLAFLAWSSFFNDDGNGCPAGASACLKAALLDAERAAVAVARTAARADVDAVVVSLHWGEEYAAAPRPADVELAHRLADAGALVVLGHHPHVLQPLELYPRADGRVAVIAYSLGNFVSNQSRTYRHGLTPERAAATRDAALLRVRLARRDYGHGVEQVEVAGVDYLPLWTENDAPEIDRRREPGRRAAIRVVSLHRALAEVRAELASLPAPVPAAGRHRFVKLRQREALYLARRRAIADLLGEELEAEPPPLPALAR